MEPKGVKGTPKGAKGSPKSAQGRTKSRPNGAQGDHMEPQIGPIGPNYINKLPINRPSGRYVNNHPINMFEKQYGMSCFDKVLRL